MKKIKNATAYQLFTTISMIGIILFFIYAIIFGRIAFDWLAIENTGGWHFQDYYRHLLFVAKPSELYIRATGEWGYVPPLLYCFYYLLYRLTSLPGLLPQNYLELMYSDHSLTVFLYYLLFLVLGMAYGFSLWKVQKSGKRLLACLLLSVPFFAGGIERGNSIILVFVLLLISLKWKESNSPIKREGALLLIAICAGIKMYPAILGLIYLKEKRYHESVRLLIYGILFFFIPFAFVGGAQGFSLWFSHITDTMVTYYSIGRIEYIKGLVATFAHLFFGHELLYLELVLPNLFLIFMIVLFIISNNKYRSLFFLCAAMTFYPPNSVRYTLSLLALPLILFLMERGDDLINDRFIRAELICFSQVFSIPTLFGFLTSFDGCMGLHKQLTFVEFWIYLFAYILLIIITVHEIHCIRIYKEINPSLSTEIFREANI